MKAKSLAIAAMAVCAAILSGCGKSETYTTDVKALPAAAQKVVADNYSALTVAQIKIERDDSEVQFTNGTKLEFTSAGEVKEVEPALGDTVPDALIPAPVRAYLRANYPADKVIKYDAGKKDNEVKVSSGIELKFDKQGKFLHID